MTEKEKSLVEIESSIITSYYLATVAEDEHHPLNLIMHLNPALVPV